MIFLHYFNIQYNVSQTINGTIAIIALFSFFLCGFFVTMVSIAVQRGYTNRIVRALQMKRVSSVRKWKTNHNKDSGFSNSGICKHPATKHFFVFSRTDSADYVDKILSEGRFFYQKSNHYKTGNSNIRSKICKTQHQAIRRKNIITFYLWYNPNRKSQGEEEKVYKCPMFCRSENDRYFELIRLNFVFPLEEDPESLQLLNTHVLPLQEDPEIVQLLGE